MNRHQITFDDWCRCVACCVRLWQFLGIVQTQLADTHGLLVCMHFVYTLSPHFNLLNLLFVCACRMHHHVRDVQSHLLQKRFYVPYFTTEWVHLVCHHRFLSHFFCCCCWSWWSCHTPFACGKTNFRPSDEWLLVLQSFEFAHPFCDFVAVVLFLFPCIPFESSFFPIHSSLCGSNNYAQCTSNSISVFLYFCVCDF